MALSDVKTHTIPITNYYVVSHLFNLYKNKSVKKTNRFVVGTDAKLTVSTPKLYNDQRDMSGIVPLIWARMQISGFLKIRELFL